MQKQKKKSNRSSLIYWLLLFIYAGALCFAAYSVLEKVWLLAEQYENSRPSLAINQYVDTLNSTLWDEGIEKTIADMPHELQTDEEVAAHVKEMLSSGITYSRKASSGQGISYNLKCNGNVFGSVDLVEDQSFQPMELPGFLSNLIPSLRPWLVSGESFDFNGLYSSVEAVVPTSYSVYVNDRLLGSEYIIEDNIPYDVLEPYYNRFPQLPTKVHYKYEHLIGSFEPEIKNENGEPVVIDKTKDDSQFMHKCSPEEHEMLASFSTVFVDKYLKYTSGVTDTGYGYGELKPYMVPGSDLDERMKQAMDGLSWAHTSSVSINSTVLNDAISLAPGVYSCDITAVATSYTIGKGEVEDTINMRVIVVNDNGNIKAVSLDQY